MSREWRLKGGVCEDASCEPCQSACNSISNGFDAALILPGDINVEVTKPDVEGNSSSGLPADARSSALKKPALGKKDA